jgi:hypothetical protein
MERRVRARSLQGWVCFCTATILLVGRAVGMASAQALPSASNPVLSTSGQFVVHASGSAAVTGNPAALAVERNLVRLEPAYAGVSCERIKQALSQEVGLGASWQGRIYVEIRPGGTAGQRITITSERFRNSWQYRVELPESVERDRYTRAVINVLLLEAANRWASGRLREVPQWLTEGLTQRLLASREIELILPPPHETVNGLSFAAKTVVQRVDDPVGRAREELHGQAPLTFDQLSWQVQDELSGAAIELYRASAQLFVGELLRLRDGRACLSAMVARMPQHYNWQLAFLEAFGSHFERLVDVEKWWALCCVQSPQSPQRELATDLPAALTWDDLARALLTPTGPHLVGDTLQTRGNVTLQTIIQEWARVQQREALSTRLQELRLLRPSLSPDLALLAAEYCQALEVYLQNPHWSKPPTVLGKKAELSNAAEEAVQRLDSLDAHREALRPTKAALTAGDTSTPAPHP